MRSVAAATSIAAALAGGGSFRRATSRHHADVKRSKYRGNVIIGGRNVPKVPKSPGAKAADDAIGRPLLKGATFFGLGHLRIHQVSTPLPMRCATFLS
jgi:hypothetical protein